MRRSALKGSQASPSRIMVDGPVLLDDPETFWVVQSGSMAVFVTTVANGAPGGGRRYLFDVDHDNAIAGMALNINQEYRALLAVPLEKIELLKVTKQGWEEFTADPHVVTLIEGWVQKIASALPTMAKPASNYQAAGTGRYLMTQGQRLSPREGTVCWVKIHRGHALWMGSKELALNPTSGILPFGTGMYLEAESATEFTTLETPAVIQDAQILLGGLARLQTYFIRFTEELVKQQGQEELQRLRKGEILERRMTQKVFRELASLAGSETEQNLSVEGTPLLVSTHAIGQALGVKICAPLVAEDSQKIEDPLEEIARASRIRRRRVLLRGDWWEKDCGPLLGYTNDGSRPVALLPVSATRYELFDPARMTRTAVDSNTASALSPVAYMLYRPLPETGLTPLGVLKFALNGRFRDVVSIFLTGIAATLLSMLIPLATAILIDHVIPYADRRLLLQIGLGLLVVVFGKTIFDLAQGFAVMRLEIHSSSSVQSAVWDRLLNLKFAFFRQYSTGDLQFRAVAISNVYQQISATTMRILFASLISLMNLLLMFYFSFRLAAVASLAALLIATVTVTSGIRVFRKSRQLQTITGKIFGLAVQLIDGVSKLRVSGAERRAFVYWGKRYREQQKLNIDIQRIDDHINLFNRTLLILASALLLWLAILINREPESMRGVSLTVGNFLAFYAAFGVFIGGATTLSNSVTDVLSVLNLWERAKPILNAELEVDVYKTNPGRLLGRVTLDHVTFRYGEAGALTLDNVSIHAEPGEFIALVGPSGGGKSTILRLLLGFDSPLSGTITYDGQNLSGLDVYAVRRQLGVVLQNSKIISAPIFENIAAGALITLEEAWEGARAAGFADDISNMPMGMYTYISEGGTNLSGGQRQRLLIARALVSKPRILIFDEATSSLDNKTQAIVTESLDRLRITRIVVAHRLSTIRNAARIYVIDSGRVVQQGTFDDLARQEGLFAQLMIRQTV